MSEIDRLLDDYKDAGVEDSEGVFTIDFAKAREKLARFQLPDPHELILKLVQAGNLASEGVAVSASSSKLTVSYQGWDSELTLKRLADRLASASLIVGDDALSYLSVGLSAMLGFGAPVRLSQVVPGETVMRTLTVGQTLEWEEGATSRTASHFEVSMPMPESLSVDTLGQLLRERCLFSSVPVSWQRNDVRGTLPQPTGAHRPAFFRENKTLAEVAFGSGQEKTPLLSLKRTPRQSARMAHLALTVDVDPKATIWLCKAGVMAEKKHLDLGVPGLIGVVAADDVPTDLTGSQFLEGEPLEGIRNWLGIAGQMLLGDAIKGIKDVVSEAQPVSSNAPVATHYLLSGCSIALVGWILGVAVIANTKGTSDWIMPNLFGWILFPIAWVAFWVSRNGCEKDDKSDRAARIQLLDILQKYQRRP